MPGKKGKNTEELEADFFGEEGDLEWLDDDSDVVERKSLDVAPAAGASTPDPNSAFPIAPPPPPPFAAPQGAASSVLPRDQKEADWSKKVSQAPVDPAALSRAKTLVFSQVPTLPPIDPDDEVTVASSPLSTERLADLSEEDQPTASVPRPPDAPPGAETSGEDSVPPPSSPAPPPTEAPAAEQVAPAVPDHPTPIRMRIPEDDTRRNPMPPATPPQPRPRATFPPFAAGDSEDKWKEIATSLMNEAAVAAPAERGEFLYRAGWVYHHRLEDLYGAESLYRDALNTGAQTPQLMRELADVAISLGRWSDAAELLHERAGLLDGASAAESLREAAVLHLDRLQNPGAGVGRLWEALDANAEDYAALVLLRDHLSDVQPERAEVLDRIALLSEGAVAAEAFCERGRLLEQSDPDESIATYRSALSAQPTHGQAFLALEALYGRREDFAGSAALYATQAPLDSDGSGWWHMLEGRSWLAAGDTKKGEAAFAQASKLGWSFAFRERQARLFQNSAWKRLAVSLSEEATVLEGPERAPVLFHLGWVRERHLEDLGGALEAYRAAHEVDSSAIPISDAVRRVLRLQGDRAGLAAFLEKNLEALTEPDKRKSLLFRLAETAEDAGEYTAARRWYTAQLDHDATSVSAMTGLARVLEQLEEWEALQKLYERRAKSVASPDLKAHFLYCAATVGKAVVSDPGAAIALHRRALDLVPDHLASLEAVSKLLAASEQWAEQARLLQHAAEASADRQHKVHLFYRAGRVLATHTEEKALARECLTNALELHADFEPALQLALDLSTADGDVQRVCTWYRGQAARATNPSERDWAWFAAAVISGLGTDSARGDIRTLLAANPDHAGGRAAWELVCIATDDYDALADICRSELIGEPSRERARQTVRLAEILLQRGRTEDAASLLSGLAGMDVEGAPLLAAARLARRVGAVDAAPALLAKIDSPWAALERASLLSRRRRGRDSARDLVKALIASHPDDLGAALVASRIGALTEDRALVAVGRARMAVVSTNDAVKSANGLWAAALLEELEDTPRALEMFTLAADASPRSTTATAGILRCLLATGDADALKELARDQRLDVITVASAAQQLGDLKGAATLLYEASKAANPVLPVLLHLEQAQEQAEDWSGVYDALVRRLDASRDDTQRGSIERRRRWILSERLSHTDEAWDLYRQLHKEEPGDRDITESLARIAGARGETALAIEYLGELATAAREPEEAARYQRRIADAHSAAGDGTAARQAYLDALDYVPSDAEALDGLKRLATSKEDWSGLIQVLQREADLVDGDRELAVRREIARVNEDKLDNGRVAIEAWRGVLEISPQDHQALTRLLVLSEREAQWGVFVETGNVLAALAKGADRTTLLRRIGVVCADQLKRDDAIRYFEQATSEDPPDLEAAQRLEALYRKRGDWKGVARSLDVQGRVGATPDSRVEALLRAARLELETRHDRDAASKYYQRILGIQGEQESALRFMASHLFEAGRFDEALPVCERLEPVVENDQDLEDFDTRMDLAQFYFYFAEMLRLAGDGHDAMSRYERALELNPTHLASLEAVGPLYTEAERWKKAEMVYRSLLQLSGGQGERHKVAGTYTQLGLVERALGNADKAQKRFNKALEIYPNHVDALKGMALLLEDREDWSNLLNIYNNIIYHATIAEDVIDAYMTKGRILDDHMSRPDKAGQHYQRSLDFKAEQPYAMLRLAELAMRRDDHQVAGELAERAMRLETLQRDKILPLLQLVVAAADQDAGRKDQANKGLATVKKSSIGKLLTPGALDDLEGLRQLIKDRMPG